MRQLKITQQITSRESISLNKYLAEISSIPLLSQEEEISLSLKIQEGDIRALNRFVEGNLRFVISVAKQYQGNGPSLDDLISAGNEGLIIAAKRFDNSRGFKFISYAVWWIRQSIMQHLTENSKAIRLPANKISIVNKIKKVSSSLEQVLQRTPTLEEIGAEILKGETIANEIHEDAPGGRKNKKSTKVDAVDLEAVLNASASLSSLDMKLGEDSESTLIDLISAETLEDINKTMEHQDLQRTLLRLFGKKLSMREKDIMIMSFGLFGEQQKSLEEIGHKFDLTRERVRQIREKSIRKLKFNSASREIREYM